METTRRLCICADRTAARDAGQFTYSGIRRAWVFVDAPRRRMSPAAKYRAFSERYTFKHTDHTGEPFAWECCPWCGADLPNIAPIFLDEGEGKE